MLVATRYVLAALAAVAALLLRDALSPWIGTNYPFLTLFAAVALVAWSLGPSPAVLTMLAGGAGSWYWFLQPVNPVPVQGPRSQMVGLIGFAAVCSFMIAVAERNRRSEVRLRREISERVNMESALKAREAELTLARDTFERGVHERTADLEQKTSELQRQAELLDLANDAILIRDAAHKISYWNLGAERVYGWTREEILGRATVETLRTEFPVPLSQILESDRWEGEIRQYKKDGSPIIVASRWTTLRDSDGRANAWLEINSDITARKRAEQAAKHLSGRFLTLQDKERRRIARGLHDSLGQYLGAIKMNLAALGKRIGKEDPLVTECLEFVDTCLSETRTISHLLHPPLLDEAGFGSAARWFVEGFARRSGIDAKLDLAADFPRLPDNIESALFRVLQEALTNVHRHSGSSEVQIKVKLEAGEVRLQVRDNGSGIPKDRLQDLLEGSGAGVGLAGMRERLRETGGNLEIQSDKGGTSINVAIPIPAAENSIRAEAS